MLRTEHQTSPTSDTAFPTSRYDRLTVCTELAAALSSSSSSSQFAPLTVHKGKKVKEVDLYSAFIEVPYTQGAQVRITQCYAYLPLPRKHSPDGASQTEVADI